MDEGRNTLQETAEISQKVLLFMAKNEIPVTPDNYKVWFEYHHGVNKTLERDVEEKRARGVPLNKEITESLYNQYFVNKDNEKITSLIEDYVTKILKEIIENVLKSLNDTTEYNKKLNQYSLTLTNVSDFTEVRRIIENIISDTKKMEESNIDMQKRLEDITAETEDLKKQIVQKDRELLKDPLTDLHNRRALTLKLKELYNEFNKSGAIFSVIMCDIDLFKQFNDQYGHIIGDEALKIVSATLKENTKGKDFVARYGGDEFIILLPLTPLYSSSIVADNLRMAVYKIKLRLKYTGKYIKQLGISLGISQIRAGDTIESVISRADASLSLAKKDGRDNVKSEKDLSP